MQINSDPEFHTYVADLPLLSVATSAFRWWQRQSSKGVQMDIQLRDVNAYRNTVQEFDTETTMRLSDEMVFKWLG